MSTSSRTVSLVLLSLVLCQIISADPITEFRLHRDGVHTPAELPEEHINSIILPRLTRQKRAPGRRALSPSAARSMYKIPGGDSAGSDQTVAIVIAYGASTAESDLNVFSTRFGLPSCTTANGCFRKVDQEGGNNIPIDDPNRTLSGGWGGEANLDLQWVHAMAPLAKLILVCANTSSSLDMYPAVKTAAALADIVVMSWGGFEGNGPSDAQTSMEAWLAETAGNGVSFFAATGDDGQAATYPASSPSVVAVGGVTTLTEDNGALSSETAWLGSAGGCSAVYSASSAQLTFGTPCGYARATPDIAFNGDPSTGVPVYCNGTYYQFGGTSLAAPIAGGRAAAVKSTAPSVKVIDHAYVYQIALYRDITSGNNNKYSARFGFDMVTGRGVWIGDSAVFQFAKQDEADVEEEDKTFELLEEMPTVLPNVPVQMHVVLAQETAASLSQVTSGASRTESTLLLTAAVAVAFSLFMV